MGVYFYHMIIVLEITLKRKKKKKTFISDAPPILSAGWLLLSILQLL